MPNYQRAVFLDKDGTLVENIPYNVDPDRLVLTPGAIAGLRLLHEAGYLLIIISNQSGVARGYFAEADLSPIMHRLRSMLKPFGVLLSGFYYCPHHLDGSIPSYAIECNCRKPQPGLLYQAAQEHRIDLRQSWFVGDILHDVAAGRSAGCRTILLDNGNETEWQLSRYCLPHHVVSSLFEAAKVILTLDTRDVLNSDQLYSSEFVFEQPSSLT
jgi:D,D-heptose 1,7-bisphosphate phosphatase